MAKSNFIKDFAKQNPIVTIVVVGVGGFLAYRGIRKLIRNKPNVPVVPPIPPVPPVPGGGQTQSKYTFGAQQYADFAERIHNAMYPLGTDEDAIANVLKKMVTYNDVLALIDAYGTRSLREWYGGDSDPLTLSESFYADMSPEYIETYVNQPLKKTGYKF